MNQKNIDMTSSSDLGWTGVSGERDNGPFVLRHITDVQIRPNHRAMLRIVWIYASENTGKLPNERESMEMADFENLLVESLQSDQLALLTAALTFDGARQWIWYTSDISECGVRINNFLATEEPYPIELDGQEDPEWIYLKDVIIGPVASDT